MGWTAVAEIGKTSSFSFDRDVKVRGESHANQLRNNFLPFMKSIASANDRDKVRSYQKDGASSHRGAAAPAKRKNDAPKSFMDGVWPAMRPDLSVLDYQAWPP